VSPGVIHMLRNASEARVKTQWEGVVLPQKVILNFIVFNADMKMKVVKGKTVWLRKSARENLVRKRGKTTIADEAGVALIAIEGWPSGKEDQHLQNRMSSEKDREGGGEYFC